MNLSQLEVLVAIVETGSLTEAAEVVGLTQSAVSYSLSKLEAELGVTLLERGRQGIAITRIGEEVLGHARTVIAQTEIIRQKTARERGMAVGKVRLGCVPRLPPRLLTGIIRDFQHKYPEMEVVLFEGTPTELVDWLQHGIIDVGTTLSAAAYPISAPLVQDEIVALLAPQHPLAAQDCISMPMLMREPLIGPKAELGVLNQVQQLPHSLNLRYEVSTHSTIFAMVRENLGVSMMPQMLLYEDHEGLVMRSFDPPIPLQVHLAAREASPATQAFITNASAWAQAHGFLPDE